MVDKRAIDPRTETSNEHVTINNFRNLKRDEKKFYYTKVTISYKILFQMNQTCKFYIVNGYYKFQ